MSTHQTTAPAAEGKANAGAVQDSWCREESCKYRHWRSGSMPTHRRGSDCPTWSPVAEPVGDLLDLIAEHNPATSTEVDEWDHFKAVLAEVARATGLIDQNAVRPLLRGEIKPQRIGAFYHRAAKAGLIAWTGQWHESDDLDGKNSGKPTRVYKWMGTAP